MSKFFTAFAFFAISAGVAPNSRAQSDFVRTPVVEGFNMQPPAFRFQTAWLSTLELRSVHYKTKNLQEDVGSVSVVKRLEKGDKVYLGLITAKHVLPSLENRKLRLYREIEENTQTTRLDYDDADYVRGAKYVWHSPSKTYDLSFFVIEATRERAHGLDVLSFPNSCAVKNGEPLLSIGFPNVSVRPKANRRVEIEEAHIVTKRWSQGFFVGDRDTGPSGPLAGTTLDGILGSSGAPVLNRQGDLVGIVSETVKGGVSYEGEDGPKAKSLVGHTYIVECEPTKRFSETAWAEFLATLPQGI